MRPLAMRAPFLLSLAALSTLGAAQVLPAEFGIGYASSARFARDSGGYGRLTGPELTIQQKLLNVPLLGEASIGVSAFLGGVLQNGGDTDGNVFRVFARGKSPGAGPNGMYFIGGPYMAFGSGRGGSFGEVNGVGLDVGLGFPLALNLGLPSMPSTSVEIINHQGSRAELRGWSVGIMIRM